VSGGGGGGSESGPGGVVVSGGVGGGTESVPVLSGGLPSDAAGPVLSHALPKRKSKKSGADGRIILSLVVLAPGSEAYLHLGRARAGSQRRHRSGLYDNSCTLIEIGQGASLNTVT
jgi:hypothetical protein